MRIVAIIQARLGSVRFPNKVLADICGKPLIAHIVERLTFSKRINTILLATTDQSKEDVLETWSKQNRIACFRGSENDVLDRYYQAACFAQADIIVRVTADDPFKDPEVIDAVIARLESGKLDFVCNNNPPSFPEGLDAEVFTFDALRRAHLESQLPLEREHVTQFFYRHPERFLQENVSYTQNLSYFRWTIDVDADLKMVRKVYEALYREGKIFLMEDILSYLRKNPAIAQINADVQRSMLYQKDNKA